MEKVIEKHFIGGKPELNQPQEVIQEVKVTITPGEQVVEAIETETNTANDQALVAYQNWANLSVGQRDKVLKVLLGDFIHRHRENYI